MFQFRPKIVYRFVEHLFADDWFGQFSTRAIDIYPFWGKEFQIFSVRQLKQTAKDSQLHIQLNS
ncbi:MAG TPA: hypothetical protein DHV48_16965 [Prolixibacteraceae bacterium]|nr:hypothetical protein [Prolixibacteraceae bacterium]